jgi:hypothetical protein
VLERLHAQGLAADIEVPVFLRGGAGTSDRFRAIREQLVHLREPIREWSQRNGDWASSHTQDYIDLQFAYAFARLGESSRTTALMGSAQKKLSKADAVHRWLLAAFVYRIEQCKHGKGASGPLPERLLVELEGFDQQDRYKVNRLRQHSRILEPHEALDAYRVDWRHFSKDSIAWRLERVADVRDRGALEKSLRELLAAPAKPEEAASVLTAALELAWRLGEDFAKNLLRRLPAVLKAGVPAAQQVKLLEKALLAAGHFDLREGIPPLLDQLRGWLNDAAVKDEKLLEALETALGTTFQGLRKLGMREPLLHLHADAGKGLRAGVGIMNEDPQQMRLLLALAAAGLSQGLDGGWPDIDRVRDRLLGGDHPHEGHVGTQRQTLLGVAYLHAVGQGPLTTSIERFHEFFANTTGVRDNATVNTHYSLKQLDVVEALVLTMTSESFTMDRSARGWLDDEEYLIRRRIHRDVRAAIG